MSLILLRYACYCEDGVVEKGEDVKGRKNI